MFVPCLCLTQSLEVIRSQSEDSEFRNRGDLDSHLDNLPKLHQEAEESLEGRGLLTGLPYSLQ